MNYREILIFGGIAIICLFMTIHNNNLEDMEARNNLSNEQKISQQEYLADRGLLIKLSNGVTMKKSDDLIIIEQSHRSIIINSKDSNQIVAFLESN